MLADHRPNEHTPPPRSAKDSGKVKRAPNAPIPLDLNETTPSDEKKTSSLNETNTLISHDDDGVASSPPIEFEVKAFVPSTDTLEDVTDVGTSYSPSQGKNFVPSPDTPEDFKDDASDSIPSDFGGLDDDIDLDSSPEDDFSAFSELTFNERSDLVVPNNLTFPSPPPESPSSTVTDVSELHSSPPPHSQGKVIQGQHLIEGKGVLLALERQGKNVLSYDEVSVDQEKEEDESSVESVVFPLVHQRKVLLLKLDDDTSDSEDDESTA